MSATHNFPKEKEKHTRSVLLESADQALSPLVHDLMLNIFVQRVAFDAKHLQQMQGTKLVWQLCNLIVEEKKLAPQVAAISKKKASPRTFDGHIVSLTGDKLVMSSKEGTEYTHTLAKDAKLTCDGTVCTAETLKPGHKIRVTSIKDERRVVSEIESLNKNAYFAECGSTCS